MSSETFTYGFFALVALSIALPAIQQWNLRRLVRASLGLERICRKTDLEERELKFDVLGSLKYSNSDRVIRVAFSFQHGMPNVVGNGWVRLDPVEIFARSDSHNRAVEADIIRAIERVRARHANQT